MKTSDLKKRLCKDRPSSVVQIRIPDDVISDLRRVAPHFGIPDYQSLICHYVGKCLREDLESLEHSPTEDVIRSLGNHDVQEETFDEAI